MIRFFTFAVLLSGCVLPLPRGAERPPRADDLAVVDAVITAWRAGGEPYTSRCEGERASRMVIIRADQITMRGDSGGTGPGYCASHGPCCGSAERQHACGCAWDQGAMGCAAGSTTWQSDIVDPLASLTSTYRVMIWISAYEDAATQRRLIAHEATHWLSRCGWGDPDSAHAHRAFWGAQGYEAAAMVREQQ